MAETGNQEETGMSGKEAVENAACQTEMPTEPDGKERKNRSLGERFQAVNKIGATGAIKAKMM